MHVKILVAILLVISGLAGCATDGSFSPASGRHSRQNDECALAGRAFFYSCSRR